MKTYIGIDFSINFPTICILEENKYNFYSLIRQKELKKKSTRNCYEYLNKFDIINFIVIDNLDDLEYSDSQVQRSIDSIKISDSILNIFNDNIKDKLNSIVCIEGFSYSSKGNRLAELSGYQYVLRSELLKNKFNFSILSPKTIKKFAGNGNYKKEDMVKKFLENDKIDSEIMQNLNNNRNILLNNLKPNKPFEDIADVFWICEAVKSTF